MVAWPASGAEVEACKRELDRKGIPHFITPERAARALASLLRYAGLTAKLRTGRATPAFSLDLDRVAASLAGVRASGLWVLTEHESKAILSLCGIRTTREELASSAEDAIRAARAIGFPVALKIASPSITHKTDVGGVWLDIKNELETEMVYDDIVARVRSLQSDVPVDGVLVQEMLPGKLDLIVGAVRDAAFGPVVMFGLGGISVEILRDVSFGIAPLSREDASEIVREVKAFPALTGARGRAPVDLEAVSDLLMRVSALMQSVDCIQELDLNPVMADAESLVVADARIVMKE